MIGVIMGTPRCGGTPGRCSIQDSVLGPPDATQLMEWTVPLGKDGSGPKTSSASGARIKLGIITSVGFTSRRRDKMSQHNGEKTWARRLG